MMSSRHPIGSVAAWIVLFVMLAMMKRAKQDKAGLPTLHLEFAYVAFQSDYSFRARSDCRT